MSTPFDLLLFSTDPILIPRAVAAGVAAIVVDWENVGKAGRQAAADTEINHHTVDDLRRVRACTAATVICRINAFGPLTPGEVERAVAEGADEILLPMVQAAEDVESVLHLLRGRCRLGILVETDRAVASASALAALPLARVYVGLNDLAIERGSATIFRPLVDGTLEELRAAFSAPFGFGGLTLPERGSPIPCRLLIGEMARLDCAFSFLRRSFHRDIVGLDVADEIPRLHEAVSRARGCRPLAVTRDREELKLRVARLESHTAPVEELPRSA